MKDLNQIPRSYFANLPIREWDEESEYSSVILVPQNKKHNSGYAWFSIVGVTRDKEDNMELEIAGYCDVLRQNFCISGKGDGEGIISFDCLHKSKYMRFFNATGKIKIGQSLSSTGFKFI